MSVIVLRPPAIQAIESLSGSGAPNNASYLVLTSSSQLVNERVIQAGPGIKITDNGPGGILLFEINSIFNEEPLGAKDGINVFYSLASVPNPQNSLCLYINGIRQLSGSTSDYLLSGSTVVMNYALVPTDNILADYLK